MFQLSFFCLFYVFLHIFLKILRLFNVIKIAVNLFMQWKECLTNGQMLARSDHYIFFSQFAWNSFLARCLQTFRAYYFYTFFLQMIQQSTVVVHFSIFFQGIISIVGISNKASYTHGLQTLGEEIAFTARLKINSQSQIFWYCQSIFCLPHQP